jgi:leucyl/phenylalanyl-tRNA--protein transferase
MSLTPDILLHGYSIGIFPMAEHRDDPDIFWVDPKRRGILPLDGFHISRSLAKRMRNTKLRVSVDQDFLGVVDGCADRIDTWINAEIRSLYLALFERNQAHSIEVWDNDELVGGVYGVTLGAAFFGESMFSRRTDASKIALACLTQMLTRGGFELFDTQFITDHLASL